MKDENEWKVLSRVMASDNIPYRLPSLTVGRSLAQATMTMNHRRVPANDDVRSVCNALVYGSCIPSCCQSTVGEGSGHQSAGFWMNQQQTDSLSLLLATFLPQRWSSGCKYSTIKFDWFLEYMGLSQAGWVWWYTSVDPVICCFVFRWYHFKNSSRIFRKRLSFCNRVPLRPTQRR